MKHTHLVPSLFSALHDPVTGRPAADHPTVCRALLAGQLAELMISGRLAMDGGRVVVTGRAAAEGADPTGTFVVETLAHRGPGQPVRSWIAALGGVLHDRVAQDLVDAGRVRREQPRLPRTALRWPATDPVRGARARLELRHMVAEPRAFDLPGATAVACVLAAGVEGVFESDPALLADLLAALPTDLSALIGGLADPTAMEPTTRFAGSRLVVESAVMQRRGDDPAGGSGTAGLRQQHDAAAALVDAGRPQEAVPVLERAVAEAGQALGPQHPDTLVAEGNLAVAYLAAGRPDVGIPLLVDTLDDRERTLGADHPVTLTARDVLASVHRTAGRPAEALAHYQLVVDGRTRVLGPSHPHTLTSRLGTALSLADDDDLRDALAVLGSALRDAVDACGPAHPVTVAIRGAQAACLASAGRPVEARTEYDRAARDAAAGLGRTHPDTLALEAALTI
ncbi:tetratricopeptide repeat protein [Pseudonocardia saturnea]